MTKNIPEKQTKELTALINEYTVWRKTRKGRTAIPTKLWERTIKLTKYYSVGKLTQILRLNYQKLKNCSQEASQPVIQEKFIEVKSSPGVISPNIIEYEKSKRQ